MFMIGMFTGEKQSGKIRYPDGRRYEGEWASNCQDDHRSSNGSLSSSCLIKYPNGVGKMTYPDKRVEEGRWKLGKFVGKLVKE